MKNFYFTIAIIGASAFTTSIYAQSTSREPASQQAADSGGLTPTEKAIQTYNDKSTLDRTIEGFNKGMERYDPGSAAAAAGTVIWNESQKGETKSKSSSARQE